MKTSVIVSLAGAGLLLAAAAGGASAAPVSGLGKLDLVTRSGGVEQVNWRRHHNHHHHWRHRWWGPRYSLYGYGNCWWRFGRRYCAW